MVFIFINLVILCIRAVFSWNDTSFTQLHFNHRSFLDGYDTLLFEIIEVDSMVGCALSCIQRGECLWFYIHETNKQCKLYGEIFWLSNPVSSGEWKYYGRNYNNVAVGRNVMQSSTHLNAPVHFAEKAVDGIVQDVGFGMECSTTSYESSPWLIVDLDDTYIVDFVVIFNRRDGEGERLHNVEVRLGSTEADLSVLCGFYAGPAKDRQVVHIPCQPNSSGRYIRIQILPSGSAADKVLTICELEIHVQ